MYKRRPEKTKTKSKTKRDMKKMFEKIKKSKRIGEIMNKKRDMKKLKTIIAGQNKKTNVTYYPPSRYRSLSVGKHDFDDRKYVTVFGSIIGWNSRFYPRPGYGNYKAKWKKIKLKNGTWIKIKSKN